MSMIGPSKGGGVGWERTWSGRWGTWGGQRGTWGGREGTRGGRADERTSGRADGQTGVDEGGRGRMRGGRADGEQKRGLWAIRPPDRPPRPHFQKFTYEFVLVENFLPLVRHVRLPRLQFLAPAGAIVASG